MWKESDIAWLSGLFEGEGTIGFPNNGTSVRLVIKMTDLDVLQTVQKKFGGSIKGPEIRDRKKPAWSWAVYSREECAKLLMALFPYLHSRRQETAFRALELIYNSLKPKPCVYCDKLFSPTNSKHKYCPECQIKKSGSARAKRAKEKSLCLAQEPVLALSGTLI